MVRAAVLAVLAAAACGDPQLVKLEEIRDEVCACKTPECAAAALKKVPAKDVVSDHRSQKLAKSMMECVAELNAQDRPSTDPDAPQDGSGSATSP